MASTAETARSVSFGDEAKTVLRIQWEDDHVSRFPLAYLRGWCPCADCQGHGGDHGWIDNDGPELTGIEPMGNYAVGLRFADGHSTGIYPWTRLREWCPCETCGGPLEGTPPGLT